RPGSYYSYPLSDAQIKENIEDELWWSPFVNESDVTVTVLGKVATLTGSIDSWRERNAAIENAYEGGAYSVIDKMFIDYGTN
ncbi:MAG: BON domain-containing protein, partial [Saprospiraceae bacterium]|nr:BON domain-containing protein [Saprospiraceae bacterium]